MGPLTHRSGAVPKAGPAGQPGGLDGADGLGQLGHSFGQQPRVGRIGHVRRDHGRVGPDLVQLDEMRRVGLLEQPLVQRRHRRIATTRGDLHQRGWIRNRIGEPDAAEPPPSERVGHLAAEGLETESIAEAQEHHAQVGLDRDGGPTDIGAEERDERLEEDRVVEQAIDARKSRWQR